MLDDQPVWLKTRGKPIVNVPYTQECNDVAMMLIQHHKASEYCERALDQFEQIYADAADSARIMALSFIPTSWARRTASNISAASSRSSARKHDVLFWTGSQIVDWYLRAGPKAP